MKRSTIRQKPRVTRARPDPSNSWEQMFKVLVYFYRAHGHCRVRPGTELGSLRHWLDQQRTAATAGRLSPQQTKRLQALGALEPDALVRVNRSRIRHERKNDNRWDNRFAQLLAYKKIHGHCRVNRRTGNLLALGQWLANQRQLANAGRLRPDRLKRLRQLGIERGRADQQRWNEKFAELQAYKKRFGHCDVPCHSTEFPVLGGWVSNQRSFQRRGTLSKDRIERLDQLGFTWSIHVRGAPRARPGKPIRALEEFWDYMFAALQDYKTKHGDCNVRPEDGMEGKLCKWCAKRRAEARTGTLREDRRQKLDEIGFPWKVERADADNWNQKFAALVAYRNKFGDCDVPCHWSEFPALGNWVSNQRRFRINGMLSQDRIERLDSIGFKWTACLGTVTAPKAFDAGVGALDQLWEGMFEEFIRFRKEHGHERIPGTDARWCGLYRWTVRQRILWRSGQLTEARQRQLEEAGFQREAYNPLWDLKFGQLLEYKKRFGHCEVPARWPEDMPLAGWVHNQRAFKRKGKLSPERIRRLNEIGFSWGNGRWPVDKSCIPGTASSPSSGLPSLGPLSLNYQLPHYWRPTDLTSEL